ncbi:hypothetical protein EGN72_15260 [Pseudorhodobacter sp. E13]|nr:hypothetical protein EGN72_15260 [Pseudorhodobacter sp. E13]
MTFPRVKTSDNPVALVIEMVAERRHAKTNAFWYKENGELLSVLRALDWPVQGADLRPYDDAGAKLLPLLRFFPQYYRLILGFSYDLNVLSGTPHAAQPVAAWAEQSGLAAKELSDVARVEADFLIDRALNRPQAGSGHATRLQAFCENSDAFRLPDRAAAYSLTHMVFYATDYGRKPMAQNENIRRSLIHAGLVAWLDQDMDILAEVVLALRFSEAAVPDLWANAVLRAASDVFCGSQAAAGADDFHEMLMLNWAAGQLGGRAFAFDMPHDATTFHRPERGPSALQELSAQLFALGDQRRGDWGVMRWRLWPALSEPAQARLAEVEAWPEFTAFFQGFARADLGVAA